MFKFIILLSLISCNSSYQHRTDWQKVYEEEGFKDKCLVKVDKTIKVEGVFDGKGCTYTWVGKSKEHCHASEEISESHPRLFDMMPSSTLKNLHIDCILEGVRMNDNTTIENVVFRDAGEDAINTKGTLNTIKNNKFYLCQDKCIQGNQANKVVVTNNFFKHALRPFSGSGSTKGGADLVEFENNKCENCEIMIRAQSDHEVKAKSNQLAGGECMFESVDESTIYDLGNNTVTNATLVCKDNKNEIKK